MFVDSLLGKYVKSPFTTGISIMVSCDGDNHFYNYGEVSKGTGAIPTKTTGYELGAVTDIFTGQLIAKAIGEKKFAPDDEVNRFLPDGNELHSFKGKSISIRHLVTHTAGWPAVPIELLEDNAPGKDPFVHFSQGKLIQEVTSLLPLTDPGTDSRHSMLGFGLLGIILERVYEKEFQKLLSDDLESTNSLYNTYYISKEQRPGMAPSFSEDGEAVEHWTFNGLPAAGGLISCTSDLADFVHRIKNSKNAYLYWRPLYEGRPDVACGWYLKKMKNGETLVYQSGGTAGASAFCGFLKDKDVSVILLANSPSNLEHLALALMNFCL
jgi:CubicO group peptidase (beta-lactamase class C family)